MLDHEDTQKHLIYLCTNELSYSSESQIEFGINKLRGSIPYFTIGINRNSFNVFIENDYITLEKYIERRIKGDKTIMICVIYKSKTIENMDTNSIVDEVRKGHWFIEKLLVSDKRIDNCKHQILNSLENNDINPIEKNLFGIIDVNCTESNVNIYCTHICGKNYTRLTDIF